MDSAPLTADDKRWMFATEVCRSCPHDPAQANPCQCGIRWSYEAGGGWAISDRWAVERAATPLGHEVPGARDEPQHHSDYQPDTIKEGRTRADDD